MRKLRIARTAATIAMAGLLAVPGSAFAAVRVTVDGGEYTEASTGEGWSWDGAYDMGLNGYSGGSIYSLGDLVITLTGENSITGAEESFYQGIVVRDSTLAEERGALTITGEGSLDLAPAHIYADGDVVIDGTTVHVNSSSDVSGIYGRDNVVIRNGSVVEVNLDTNGPTSMYYTSGVTADNSTVVIDGSRVVVNTSSPDERTSGAIAASNLQWFADDPEPNTPQIVLTGGSEVVTPESWIIGEHRTDDWSSDNYDYYEIYLAQPGTAREDGSPEPLLSVVIDYLVPELEQATMNRTVSYIFEDGSEAAPTFVDAVSFTRMGERYSGESYIAWHAWEGQTFTDVASPEIKGYAASLTVVKGETVDGDAADLVYTVVYTPEAEFEKVEPVEPEKVEPEKLEPESVEIEKVELLVSDEPIFAGSQLPKTADGSSAVSTAVIGAAGVAALAAGGVLLRRRQWA